MAWNGSDGKGVSSSASSAANRRSCAPTKKASANSFIKGIVAAVIVVCGAGLCLLWLSQHDGVSSDATPAKVKTVAANNGKPTTHKPQSEKPLPIATVEQPDEKPQTDTNRFQIINGFKVPKGARLVRNSLTNKQERVFERASDALIASYLQPAEGGIMPPPLPMVGNAEKKFLESLATPIEILDTDSEDIRRQKEAVIIAREQIKQRMDEGEKFEAILADHYNLSAENAKIRRNAQKELDAIYSSGDIDGAAKYKRVIDIALSQMGVDALDEPMTNAERKKQRKLKNAEAEENMERQKE